MKFLNKTECESLIQRRLGSDTTDDVHALLNHRASLKLKDIDKFYLSNRILSTYRIILEEVDASDEYIAFFDNIGVWQSQNDGIFSRLLWKSYTNHSPIDRPGIVFTNIDFEKIYAFFCLSFYSGWDSTLILDKSNWIFFSHDDYLLCKFEDKSIEDFLKK